MKEKSLTIGIAGHSGHGKTTLARLLTLKDSAGKDGHAPSSGKRSASTPDAQHVPLVLPSGIRACLVDVPGNPKYFKSTVRALCHVDMAILVISAEDGVMPQTHEHLRMLHYFGAKMGIAVLTRCDLADDETIAIAELETAELLEKTFLDGCPVLRFSEKSQKGFPLSVQLGKIIDALDRKAPGAVLNTEHLPFRLSIDRVRQFPGFGTVATGTVLSGSIKRNDPLLLLPEGRTIRARFLQSHGREIECAEAGARIGINLHKTPFDSIKKGMVLTRPGIPVSLPFINSEIHVHKDACATLHDRMRIRLFVGTAITTAILVMIDGGSDPKIIRPGETGLVQLRTGLPTAAFPGDRFAVSLLGSARIVGGGTIFETTHIKYRRVRSALVAKRLKAIQDIDITGYVDAVMDAQPFTPFSAIDLAGQSIFSTERPGKRWGRVKEDEMGIEIRRKIDSGAFLEIRHDGVVKKKNYDRLVEKVLELFESMAGAPSQKFHFHLNEIAGFIKATVSRPLLEMALDELCRRGLLLSANGHYQLPLETMKRPKRHDSLLSKINDFAVMSWPKPFTGGYFCKYHSGRFEKKDVERLLKHIAAQNHLIALDHERYILPDALEEAKQRIRKTIEENGVFYIHDCTPVLGYGRSQAVSVLEYLDASGFTVRQGNARVLK